MKMIAADFLTAAPEADENFTKKRPHAVVRELAKKKARAAKATIPSISDTLIIAADTIVFFESAIVGKPIDEADAFRMLKRLSGRQHAVYTGVCFLKEGKERVFYDKSLVRMKKLSDGEIRHYIEECRPLDKAGAYGVQDGGVVESYIGSYFNIMGFPVEKISKELKIEGLDG
jgi:septum formation protein